MPRRKHDPTSISLHLEGQVTLKRLGEALEAWTDMLREVASDVVGVSGRDAVRFVVTESKAGSYDLVARPQPAKQGVPVAAMPLISKTITTGVRALERSATRPKHFNDAALLKLRDLARLTDPETPSVKIGNGTGAVLQLSSRLVANVEAVLAPEISSIGTIEGLLEGLITHGKNRFYIYDPLTAKQVICYFGERIRRDDVLQAYGKRVAATGHIRSRRSGERVSVQASRLYVFPPESELPSAADVRGILKATK